jgi:hypothetical protein
VPKPLAGREPAPAEEAPDPPDPGEVAEAPVEPATVPLPQSERRTIQIGERPGPTAPTPPASPMEDSGATSLLRAWGPRLAAALALVVVALILFLLLS